MPGLRAELREVVDALLRENEPTATISLDSIGAALGERAVSYVEVDAMLEALELAGRVIESGEAPRGEQHLRVVVMSIRELSATLGRRPSMAELTEHAQLSIAQVSHALRLARIMQR